MNLKMKQFFYDLNVIVKSLIVYAAVPMATSRINYKLTQGQQLNESVGPGQTGPRSAR